MDPLQRPESENRCTSRPLFLNVALRDARLGDAFLIARIALEVGIEPTVRYGRYLGKPCATGVGAPRDLPYFCPFLFLVSFPFSIGGLRLVPPG